ncbi:MAG: hypothetical protein ABIE94_02825 [archaeon]
MRAEPAVEKGLVEHMEDSVWDGGGCHRSLNATTDLTTAMIHGEVSPAIHRRLVAVSCGNDLDYFLGAVHIELAKLGRQIRHLYQTAQARVTEYISHYRG